MIYLPSFIPLSFTFVGVIYEWPAQDSSAEKNSTQTFLKFSFVSGGSCFIGNGTKLLIYFL